VSKVTFSLTASKEYEYYMEHFMKIYCLTDSEEVLKFFLYMFFIKFRSITVQVIVSKIKHIFSNFNFNNGEETFFKY